MPFKIIRNDITKVKADIIVNTAKPRPMIGGGTDNAIYTAAGADALLAERKKNGNIEFGEAAVTLAFSLAAHLLAYYLYNLTGQTRLTIRILYHQLCAVLPSAIRQRMLIIFYLLFLYNTCNNK